MQQAHAIVRLLTLVLVSVPLIASAEQPVSDLNQAQELVFRGEHLRTTRGGQTLVYAFTRRAGGEPDKADEVRMTVTGVVDEARRDLSFAFLSGADRLHFPDAQGYRGNPVVIQFLERDIRGMAQQIGTPVALLRNRIRAAFRDPQVAQTRLRVGDRLVDATEIVVIPFAQDPAIGEADGYAGKEYLFAYSDQIPGDLIRVGTRMARGDGTMLEEELRFDRAIETPRSAVRKVPPDANSIEE